jgi:hypothetical protein
VDIQKKRERERERARSTIEKSKARTKGQQAIENKAEVGARGIIV